MNIERNKLVRAAHAYSKKFNSYRWTRAKSFLDGAESAESKAFHTQGMYTKEQVIDCVGWAIDEYRRVGDVNMDNLFKDI